MALVERWCDFGRSWAVLPLMLVLVALASAACGNDDRATPTAVPTALDASTASLSPSDAKSYVKTVCIAFGVYFQQALDAATADPSILNDPQRIAAVAVPALSKFSDDLGKVTLPKEIQNYHQAILQAIGDLVRRLNNGQVRSEQELIDVFRRAQGGQDIQATLALAAKDVSDCQANPFVATLFEGQRAGGSSR
jgi:hypothetical protein